MADSPDWEAEGGKDPVWHNCRDGGLIAISRLEFENLRADEMAVITAHFKTEDRAELARKLADEAEEMWGGDHASVPNDEWPNAHLRLLLDMYREEREDLLAKAREDLLAPLQHSAGLVRAGINRGRRRYLRALFAISDSERERWLDNRMTRSIKASR